MTSDSGLDVSVVVPTYNRSDRLRRVLVALDRQITTTPDGRTFTFEVVVVSDGSTDDTVEVAEKLETSYPLRVMEQENSGPAGARNRGVQSHNRTHHRVHRRRRDTRARVACELHVSRHDASSDLVVIGPMLTPGDADLSPWVAWEQHQLYKQYERFAAGEPAYPRQFYTGNASVLRTAFTEAGGFDTSFRRAEDVELALRMDSAGPVIRLRSRGGGVPLRRAVLGIVGAHRVRLRPARRRLRASPRARHPRPDRVDVLRTASFCSVHSSSERCGTRRCAVGPRT